MKGMKGLLAAGAAGAIFAVGLGISGMTQPQKILGFLDVFGGHWDPSLAMVMLGAIAVHLPVTRWLRVKKPVFRQPATRLGALPLGETDDDGPGQDTAAGSRLPAATMNLRLIVGAAIFGVGWAISGYCPGPALVTLVGFSPGILVFLASMMSGMWIFHLLSGRNDRPPRQGRAATVTHLPWRDDADIARSEPRA